MKNVHEQEIVNPYESNETMRMLGEQKTVDIFWRNTEVRKQIEDISKAFPFSFTDEAAADIFTLGYIYGKRAERARKKAGRA